MDRPTFVQSTAAWRCILYREALPACHTPHNAFATKAQIRHQKRNETPELKTYQPRILGVFSCKHYSITTLRLCSKSQDSTEEAPNTFDMRNYAKTKLQHGRFYAVSTTIPKISPNPMKSVTLKEVPRTITVVIVAITGSMVPRSTARMEPAS